MRTHLAAGLLVALALAIAACGGEDTGNASPEGAGDDTAIDARETTVVRLGGVHYRVMLFRELNANVEPDRALVQQPPADRHGYWAAFVEACNLSGEAQVPADRVVLETAFGRAFRPRQVDSDYAYEPRPLQPDACLPGPGSTADATFDGAALVFEVPYEAVQNRPLVLELRTSEPTGGADHARIELDL